MFFYCGCLCSPNNPCIIANNINTRNSISNIDEISDKICKFKRFYLIQCCLTKTNLVINFTTTS